MFVKHRRSILLRKRLPSITILFCIVFIIDNFIATFALIHDLGISDNKTIGTITNYIKLIFTVCSFGFHACFVIKFWFLFFDIHYIRMTVNSKWHSIIDPTFRNTSTIIYENAVEKPLTPTKTNTIAFLSYPWFISKKKTLGNESYIIKLVFTIYTTLAIIALALQLIKLSHFFYFLTFLFVVCCFFCFALFYVCVDGCKLKHNILYI